MQFRIVGADRETGQDVSKVVDEPSRDAAEARALRMGVMIERIEQVEPSAPPPQAPIAELAAALQDAVPQTAPGRPNQRQTFHTKVRGVTHKTRTGENRQDVIAGCFPGERLSLVREPENPHDRNAIMVLRSNSQHIGYIGAELAVDLAPLMDQGTYITAHVSSVTGGGRKYRGLNLKITKYPPGVAVETEPLERWAEVGILARWSFVLCVVLCIVALFADGWPRSLCFVVGVALVALAVPAWVASKIGVMRYR